ncbi:MAG TPA: hypothetical protein VJ348_00850 [Candidatus Humimicrobiaceae bacterium]|nr:hypothetical protein [Candidatus Humimicrobiaceae bacterium]
MKKIIIFYSFVLTTIMAMMGFLSAKSYPQLLSAILFYPLAFYFWVLIIPKRKNAIRIPQVGPSGAKKDIPQVEVPLKLHKEEDIDFEDVKIGRHVDKDRRMFLKLIGSAGASVFLLSIFTKRAQAAFFGSVPGPGTVGIKDTTGALIDPAVKQPTDGYKISRLDDSSPAYYGFTNKEAAWFIMKEDSLGNYTYAVGSSGFDSNWTNRNVAPPVGPTYGEYFDKF